MALPTRQRLRIGWIAAGIFAIITILIWALWVLPVNRSVAAASPVEIGETVSVDLDEGEQAGIWGTGRSVLLGSASCTVTAPNGDDVPLAVTRDLGWDDTLWWMTARPGYAEFRWFTAPASGVYEVACLDALETYDGTFLVADSASGSGTVGLGRSGGNRYEVSSMLAIGAVVCPLTAVLLVPVLGLQTIRVRRSERIPEQ